MRQHREHSTEEKTYTESFCTPLELSNREHYVICNSASTHEFLANEALLHLTFPFNSVLTMIYSNSVLAMLLTAGFFSSLWYSIFSPPRIETF